MPGRVRSISVLGCILVSAAVGCGVVDYEKKMVYYQDRVTRFEEMTKLLGDPLVMPRSDDKKMPTALVNLFLRPPRGIAPAPQNENDPRVRTLYTYGAQSQGAASPFSYVEIGFAKSGDGEFQGNVMKCFPTPSGEIRRQREVRPVGRTPMVFSTLEFVSENKERSYYYSLNFYKGPVNQVVVAYWFNPAARAQASRVVDLSLETFGLDADVNSARNAQLSPLTVPAHPR